MIGFLKVTNILRMDRYVCMYISVKMETTNGIWTDSTIDTVKHLCYTLVFPQSSFESFPFANFNYFANKQGNCISC